MKSSPSIWHLLHNVKSTVKILLILAAFLENMNFTWNSNIKWALRPSELVEENSKDTKDAGNSAPPTWSSSKQVAVYLLAG